MTVKNIRLRRLLLPLIAVALVLPFFNEGERVDAQEETPRNYGLYIQATYSGGTRADVGVGEARPDRAVLPPTDPAAGLAANTGGTFTFEAVCLGAGADCTSTPPSSVSWDFGDGTRIENVGHEPVEHWYKEPGVYLVRVVAEGGEWFGEATRVVYVSPHYADIGDPETYQSIILADNPRMFWAFNNNFTDSTSGENNFVNPDSGVGFTPFGALADPSNIAIVFDADEDVLRVDEVSGMPATEMSFEAWVKADEGEDGTIVSYAVEVGSPIDDFAVRNPSNLEVEISNTSISTGHDLTDGEWHHLVVTWSTVGGVGVWVDGGSVHTDGAVGVGATLNDAGSLMLGAEQNGNGNIDPGEGFIGSLDEVAIYDRVLTESEISRHHDKGTAERSVVYRTDREAIWATSALDLFDACRTAQGIEDSAVGREIGRPLFCPEPEQPTTMSLPLAMPEEAAANGITGADCLDSAEACNLPEEYFPGGVADEAALAADGYIDSEGLLVYDPLNCGDGWVAVKDKNGNWGVQAGTEDGCLTRGDWYNALIAAVDGTAAINPDLAEARHTAPRDGSTCDDYSRVPNNPKGASLLRALGMGIAETIDDNCYFNLAVTKQEAYVSLNRVLGGTGVNCPATFEDLPGNERCADIASAIDLGTPIVGNLACVVEGICFNPNEKLRRVDGATLLAGLIVREIPLSNSMTLNPWVNIDPTQVPVNTAFTIYAEVDVPLTYVGSVTINWPSQPLEAGVLVDQLSNCVDPITFTNDQLISFGSFKRTPTATCDYFVQSDDTATLLITASNDLEQTVTENFQITGVNTPPEPPKPEDVSHTPSLEEGYGDGEGGYNLDTQRFYSSDVNRQDLTFQITGDDPSEGGVRARTTGASIGNYQNAVTLDNPTGWWRLNATSVGAPYTVYNVTSKFPQPNPDFHAQNKSQMDTFFVEGGGVTQHSSGTWQGPINFTGDLPSHPGTYQGTPAYEAAGLGGSKAVVFSGDDTIQVPNAASLQITGDMTYEMWLKPASFDTRGSVIHKAYGGEGSVAQETNGRLTFYQGESGSDANPAEAFLTNQALTLDEWTHVVVTRKGSTVRWYVNGELDSTHVATLTPAASTNPLLIGNGWSGGYNGAIDEVAVYARALSASEVAEHYNLGDTGSMAAYRQAVESALPVGYWRMEEASGPTAVDSSPASRGKPAGIPSDYYALHIGGSIFIPEEGTYVFGMDVDDTGDLTIDGDVVVSQYGSGGALTGDPANNTGQIEFDTPGWYSFEARMVEGWGQDGFHIQWMPPGADEFVDLPAGQIGTPLNDSAGNNHGRLSGAGYTLGPNNSGLVAGTPSRSIDLGGGRSGAAYGSGALWALWALDSDYADSSDAGRDLWFSGNPEFVDGTGGRQAVEFKTAPTRAQINTTQFPTDAVSVEGIVRVAADGPAEATFFSYASGGQDNAFTLTQPANLNLYVAGQSTGGTGVNVADGQWHHIAVTWQSAGGNYTIYVDGVLEATGTIAPGQTLGSNGVFVIGDDQDSLGGGFDPDQAFFGELGDLAVYETALPEADIADIATRALAGEAAVDLPNSADINATDTTEKSVEAWIRTADDVTRPQGIWVEGDTDRGVAIYISEGRIWYGGWNLPSDGVDGGWGPWYTEAEIEPNTTYHVALSLGEGNLTAYLNGVEIGSTSAAGGFYSHPSARIGGAARPFVGHDGSKSMVWGFGGRVDEVAHYLKALGPDDITKRYEHGAGKVIAYDSTTGDPVAAVYGTASAASETVENRWVTNISVHPITPDSNGDFTYHIRACDSGGACSDWVPVSGEVRAEGDAPRGTTRSVFAGSTVEGGIPVTFSLSATDGADDGWSGHAGSIARYRILSGPARGTLQYDDDPGAGTNWVAYTGGTREVEGEFLRYVPDNSPNGDGYISFQYQALDTGYDANSATGLWSPPRTAWIYVENVNQAPTCYSISGDVTEDTPKSLSLAKPSGIQQGCADLDGDALRYEIVVEPEHGSAIISGAAAVYSPVANFCGEDEFTFRATDGSLNSNTVTYSINVTCVNDDPTTPTPATIAAFNEDSAGRTITVNTTDPDYEILNGETAPAQTWTFQVKGSSGAAWSTASGSNAKVNISVSQGSGDDLSASVTVTPKSNECGPYDVYVRVVDSAGGVSPERVMSGNITCVNDAPAVPTPSTMPTATEDGSNVTRDFTWTDVDDSQPGPAQTHRLHTSTASGSGFNTSNITVNLSSQGTAVVSVANINGNNPGGRVTVNPAANACGSYTFYVRAHDGHTYSGTRTVTGSVTCVNDTPTTPTGSFPASTPEDTPISRVFTTTDPDSTRWYGQVRAQVYNGSSWSGWSGWVGENTANTTSTVNLGSNGGTVSIAQGSVTANKNANVTYTPGTNFAGSVNIQVRFCDNGSPGTAACSPATTQQMNVEGFINRLTAINTVDGWHRWHISNATPQAQGTGNWWTYWNFGQQPANQIPIKGDWNGDGYDEYGLVYKGNCQGTPSQPAWHYNMNRDSGADGLVASCFGLNTDDSYMTGDWDGNGVDDLAVYRGSNTTLYKRVGGGTSSFTIGLGTANGLVSGGGGQRTVHGQGADDMFLYRSSDAGWWIRNASTGGSLVAKWEYGNTCSTTRCSYALVGGWTTNGIDYIGMYRASDGTTRMRNAHGAGGNSYTHTNGTGWEGAVALDNPS